MKKILVLILKWAFLVLFVAAMIGGFLSARMFDQGLQNFGPQKRSAAR